MTERRLTPTPFLGARSTPFVGATPEDLLLISGARKIAAINPDALPSGGTPPLVAMQHDGGHIVAARVACPPFELQQIGYWYGHDLQGKIRPRRVVPFTADYLPGFAVHSYAGAAAQYPDVPCELDHAPGSCGAPAECDDPWCAKIERSSRYDRHALALTAEHFRVHLPPDVWQPAVWKAAWALVREHFDAIERVRDALASGQGIPWQRVRDLIGAVEPIAPQRLKGLLTSPAAI